MVVNIKNLLTNNAAYLALCSSLLPPPYPLLFRFIAFDVVLYFYGPGGPLLISAQGFEYLSHRVAGVSYAICIGCESWCNASLKSAMIVVRRIMNEMGADCPVFTTKA
jgi:hypothetical protein